MRTIWIGVAIVMTACGASAPAPTASAPRPSDEVLTADVVDGRDFVVLERLGSEELPAEAEAGAVVLPREGAAETRFTLYGTDGACAARAVRLVTLQTDGLPFHDDDGVRRIERVRFAAVEVEAPCHGWIAMEGGPRADVRFHPLRMREPTDRELDEDIGTLSRLDRGAFGDYADAALEVGPIVEDDVCPEFVRIAILRDDAPPRRLELGVEEALGLLLVGAHTFAVTNFYHRRLRPLGGGATGDVDLPVPSQINTDVGAHPCL